MTAEKKEISDARRRFAYGLRDAAARSRRVIDAFSCVPRERFLGNGPWKFGVFDIAPCPMSASCWLHAGHTCLSRLDVDFGLER